VAFPSTRQTLIERIRDADGAVRRTAFGQLAEGYWRPSYLYLRRRRGLGAEAAEDIVQAFFTAAFEKEYLERYDPAKAKFRTFLRTCLDRFAQNVDRHARAARRGGGAEALSLDFPGAERELAALAEDAASDPDRWFHDEFVRALFASSVDSLREALAAEGKAIVFEVFERYDLRPGPDVSYAALASELSLTTAQVTNHLHAARRRFRDIALERLRALVGTDDEFRAEARDIFGVEVTA
jgi:DNA-directed RNA polymerase specialized sigma24 family protein